MTWEVSMKKPLNCKKVRVKVRISTTGVYLFCIYEHDYSSRGVKLSWLSYLHMYGHEGHWDTKTAKPTLVLDSVLASLPVSQAPPGLQNTGSFLESLKSTSFIYWEHRATSRVNVTHNSSDA